MGERDRGPEALAAKVGVYRNGVLLTASPNSQAVLDVAKILRERPGIPDNFRFRNFLGYFSSGERYVAIGGGIEDRYAVVFQPDVSDSVFPALGDAVKTARENRASGIAFVSPYCPGLRQIKPYQPGEAASGINDIEELQRKGAEIIVTVDVHDEEALREKLRKQGIPIRLINISAIPLLADALRTRTILTEEQIRGATAVGPDKRARLRAEDLQYLLGISGLTYFKKERDPRTKKSKIVEMLGDDPRGRIRIVIDDMVVTGETLKEADVWLRKKGGKQDTYVLITHGLFTPDALKIIGSKWIKKVIVTDTVSLNEEAAEYLNLHPEISEKIEVVSVAPLIARAINEILGKAA